MQIKVNISKFIAKFVLAFFVFSSVQGSIFAGSQEIESPDLVEQNKQQNWQYYELRERRKWKRIFMPLYFLASSAFFFCSCYAGDINGPTKILFFVPMGAISGIVGTFNMYDFLKARIWGR